MPVWLDYGGSMRRKIYKVWRYPGVPIPRRLQDTYRDPTMNGKKRH